MEISHKDKVLKIKAEMHRQCCGREPVSRTPLIIGQLISESNDFEWICLSTLKHNANHACH